MAVDRRNPYVILGIPFGADEAEARTGFARASRRLRREEDVRYAMEDLTWALHQIEQIIKAPAKAFNVYRIPADPEATAINRPGVFDPPPEPIRRDSNPATDEELRSLQERAVQELVRGALTEDRLDFTIPRPYEMKENANG